MEQAIYYQQLLEAEFPDTTGGLSAAPFDALNDTVRGTKGVMMDIRKRPN